MKIRDYVWLCAGVLVTPTSAFDNIRRKRNELSVWFAPVMLFLLVAVYLASVLLTHYPVSATDLRKTNLLFEIAVPLIPAVVWTVSGYAISTIMDGNCKFKEFACSVALSTVPFIAFTIPLTAFSYVLEAKQAALFSVLRTALLLWVVVLLLYSYMELNEYTAGQTVKTVLLSVVAMLAILFVCFILYSMTEQLIAFIRQLIFEIRLLGL